MRGLSYKHRRLTRKFPGLPVDVTKFKYTYYSVGCVHYGQPRRHRGKGLRPVYAAVILSLGARPRSGFHNCLESNLEHKEIYRHFSLAKPGQWPNDSLLHAGQALLRDKFPAVHSLQENSYFLPTEWLYVCRNTELWLWGSPLGMRISYQLQVTDGKSLWQHEDWWHSLKYQGVDCYCSQLFYL